MAKEAPERFNPVSLLRSLRASGGVSDTGKSADTGTSDSMQAPAQRKTNTRFNFEVALTDFTRLQELLVSMAVEVEALETDIKVESTPLAGEFILSEFAPQGFEDGREGEAPSMNSKTDDRAVKAPIIVAKGQFQTEVIMQCQRCLGDYIHPVRASFSFVFAANQATADAMPDSFDPVLLDTEGFITLIDMFEDELILQIPGFAKHQSEAECTFDRVPYKKHMVGEDELGSDGALKRESPFAALKGVIASNDDGDSA